MHTSESITKTLKERGEKYGDFEGGIILLVSIMDLIKSRYIDVHGAPLDGVQEECLRTIINKITRLAVTPDHWDTWTDIQGYSKLIQQSIKRRYDHARD